MRRRQLLRSGLAMGLAPAVFPLDSALALWARRSKDSGRIAAYDDAMSAYMRRTGAPGGALAVARDGRLVHHGVYGRVDRTGAAPTAATRWRVASLSKMWTASAVRQLASGGLIAYETAVVPLLGIAPAGSPDPRLAGVTVRQLLEHTAGWDSGVSGDPMFRSRSIAAALGVASPPSVTQVAAYMFGRPLDFEPGTRSAYSNFGYALLGLLIERVTGETYADHLRRAVLAPQGVEAMALGGSLVRAEHEAAYEMPSGSGMAWSVFDSAPGWVQWPYGGFALEPMAAHGGWISHVLDVARYARALDERRLLALPRPESDPIPTQPGYSYTYLFAGSLPGAFSIVRRDWNGSSYTAASAAFNYRTGDGALDGSIADDLARALARVSRWPAGEEF